MDNTTEDANTDESSANNVRLSYKSKVAYGVGHVLNDVCASMWFTYLLVYFHLVLEFSPVYAGVILLIGQVADALATPFVGLHSDKNDDFWLCRYGRRKTWHLTGTICVLGTFPFIFSQCLGCEGSHQWAQLIYYSAFVIIFQFGWASVQISHLSLIPDLTKLRDERTHLTAIRYSFTVLSNVLMYVITWAILRVTSEDTLQQIGPKDAHKFQQIVLIGMGIGLLFTIIFHVCVKEKKLNRLLDNTSQEPQPIPSPLALFKDPELYQVALIYMPTRLFVNLTQTYVPLYLHETLKMPGTALAIIPLIMYLSCFKASFTIQWINKKCGRKIAYLIGALMGLSFCAGILFVPYEQLKTLFIYPCSLLLGGGGSMMLVTSLAITADYIGQGIENGAFVYGIMSFADKLSNGIAVMAIQYMHCTSGDCSNYYKNILVYVCGGAAIFGLVMTLCRKTPTDSSNENYNSLEGAETPRDDNIASNA
ncbi:major facilitator superfamily domain-containing protein 12-like [Trichogramma pretiosum]|uniref:major facilitator superfamily domain-containing protein 12-like n=1 Tax=Trichogramma pretiosum TaxID=7493 RepID=UPI0006C97453|nr:major facilitator superfamily domain-containing protein 12-like [Trichogramma pretiosum]XP_014223882.1 major facilitator superfamily domain-containing protein 12-like [Trichogramma pretiosum]